MQQRDKRNCTYLNNNKKINISSVTANSKSYICTQVVHLAGSTKHEGQLERILTMSMTKKKKKSSKLLTEIFRENLISQGLYLINHNLDDHDQECV